MITIEELLNGVETEMVKENSMVFYNTILVPAMKEFDIKLKFGIIKPNQVVHITRLSLDNDNINGYGADITAGEYNANLYDFLKGLETTSLVNLGEYIHVAYNSKEDIFNKKRISRINKSIEYGDRES